MFICIVGIYIPGTYFCYIELMGLCMGLHFYCIGHIARTNQIALEPRLIKSITIGMLLCAISAATVGANAVITETATHGIFSQHLQHNISQLFMTREKGHFPNATQKQNKVHIVLTRAQAVACMRF